MYLERLKLQNVRLLDDQTFSFVDSKGHPRMWTVIVADNGYCKSTILQTIALLASGAKLASELVGDAATYRREPAAGKSKAPPASEQASMSARFVIPPAARSPWPPGLFPRPWIDTLLFTQPGRHDVVGKGKDSFFDDVRAQRSPGFLVIGFGVGRFLPRPGEVAAPVNPVADRVRGLFDPRHKMLATHFWEVFNQLEKKQLATVFMQELRDVLLAETEDGKLLEWLDDVELRGKPGLKKLSRLLTARRFKLKLPGRSLEVNGTALSDGYQSMVAWIADLLGHALLDAGKPVKLKDLTGIVLVDEIDLHLHPTWQRRIVPVLRKVFPRLQFIVTTHSPIVLGGFEAEEIIRLELRDGLVVQGAHEPEPGLRSATEVLTDYFDVPHAARQSLVEAERRYLFLRSKGKRSQVESMALRSLTLRLSRYWGNGAAGTDVEDV